MEYSLPLSLDINHLYEDETDANYSIRKQITALATLEERLICYNINVCSLSRFDVRSSISFEIVPGSYHYIYIGNPLCTIQGFSQESQTVFRQLRDKEVQRIIDDVRLHSGYKDQLRQLLKVKGYFFDSLQLWEHPMTDPQGLKEPLIDLRPVTTEQKSIFNELIQEHNEKEELRFNRKYKVNGSFTGAYTGFDCIGEWNRFLKSYEGSARRERKLEEIIYHIDSYFGLLENPWSNNQNVVNEFRRQLKEEFCQYDPREWLQQMIDDIEWPLDFTGIIMVEKDYLVKTHLSEISKFYWLLHRFKDNQLPEIDKFLKNISISCGIEKELIKSPEKQLFCAIVNDCGLMNRGDEESAKDFCKRVCERYGLTFKDRMIQYFSTNVNLKREKKRLQKVQELILPHIAEKDKAIINQYIINQTEIFT